MTPKTKTEERILLTKEQALSLIPKRGQVHTFRSGTGILIGADWKVSTLRKAIKEAWSDDIEIGGPQCLAMGHGLVIWTSKNNPLFIQVDNLELQKFNPLPL